MKRYNERYENTRSGSSRYINRFDRRNNNDRDHTDRTWWQRAGDEVLSWMGDDYAERRRRHDDMHAGKGPKNYRRTDERIKEDINDRLTDEWNIDASDIDVTVNSGEVILTGFVRDRFQKRRAEDVAEAVRGVRHVENRIRVDATQSKNNAELIP
jgi:osmotically-inducible protein OsmY